MSNGGWFKTVKDEHVSGGWRAAVVAAADAVRAEVRLAACDGDFTVDGSTVEGTGCEADIAREVLAAADEAVDYAKERSLPFRWLSGSHNEGAWTRIHLADELVVELMSPMRLASFAPRAAQTCRETLPPRHPQRVAVERIEAAVRKKPPRELGARDRGVLRDALRIAYMRNEGRYQKARGLRNLTLAMAAVLLVLTLAAVLTGVWSTKTLSMCLEADAPAVAAQTTTPSTTEGDKDKPPPQECPSGGAAEGKADVALVAAAGMVGAAISAARALSGATRKVGPYSPAAAQGTLKIVLGGLLAIVGVTLLRAGWVPGVDDVEVGAEILAWAFLFGYAQQLLTGLLDQRAKDALGGGGDDPPPPPPPPPPLDDSDDQAPPPGGEPAPEEPPADAGADAPADAPAAPDDPAAGEVADLPADDAGEVVDEDDVAMDEGDAPPDAPPVDEVDPTARLVPDVPAPPRKPARSAARAAPAKRATPRRGAAPDG